MSSSNQEGLANFSEVMQQYREENPSFSGTDNIFGFNPNNNSSKNKSNLCKSCKVVRVSPSFSPFCGLGCRDYYQSKIKYEMKGLLQRVGD